jgi:hypothetical protein
MKKETKEKISRTLKEKYTSKEIIPNMTGAHSLEARKKMGNTKRGKKHTKEHNEKIAYSLNHSSKFKNSFTEEKEKRKKETCLDKYGVENPFQAKEIKEKIKQTNIKKYGNSCPLNGEAQIKMKKETWLKNYGVENPQQSKEIKEKTKQTNKERYGVEYMLQSQIFKDKYKLTCLKRFGVEHPSQNEEIFKRAQKTRFKIHKYKNTDLTFQGSYELDFLNKFYDKYPDIQNGPSIEYNFKGKQRIYHPDFYIPSLNLIVEIKNHYLANKDKLEIKYKKQGCIHNKFNYIMFIDKNYHNFR